MKFSGLLNLRKNDSIRHLFTLNAGNTYKLDGENIKLEIVPAYHDELVAKEQSVGLVFDLNGDDFNRKIVFTGDTGLLPLDPDSDKPKCLSDYEREVWKYYPAGRGRPDVLVVHIGSIKSEELDGKYVEPEDACYPNHLGILGTTRVITQCKPRFAIVSEFGEEMKSFRCDLIRGLEKEVIKPSLKESPDGKECKDLRVVPGDLALIYDLKDEKFYNCVTDNWVSYKNIDFALDSDEKSTQSGIYYFSKQNNKKFKEKRKHHSQNFVRNLKAREKIYFK